jgi:hypothetical protein
LAPVRNSAEILRQGLQTPLPFAVHDTFDERFILVDENQARVEITIAWQPADQLAVSRENRT